jgi:hypothetical protein
MAKKVGRPSTYTPELAMTICHRLAGGESLRQICADPDMPSKSTVMLWVLNNEDFSDQYARAREMLMEHWSEEIVDIADDGSNDYVDRLNSEGQVVGEAVNHEHINRSRLRVDTRKWLMSKLAPKRYGDRIQTEVTGKDGGPIEYSHIDRARRLAYVLKQAAEEARRTH